MGYLFTFLIPVFNLTGERLENFKFLLSSISKLGFPILVIEQKSTGFTEVQAICKSYGALVGYISNTSDSEYIEKSKLINLGVEVIETEYVWLTDADAHLQYSWIIDNTEFWDYDVIQPYNTAKRLTQEESENIRLGKKVDVNFSYPDGSWEDYITIPFGFSCIFKRSVFDSIGKFDERFLAWGHEDTDMAIRLYESTLKFVILHLEAVHLWHPTGDIEQFNENAIINYNILLHNHGKSKIEQFQNKHRSLLRRPKCSIVTLFRGDFDLLKNIDNYLINEDFMIDTELVWVINSDDTDFIGSVYERAKKYRDVRIILNTEFKELTDDYFDRRHEFIGGLYSDIFKEYTLSDYVLTLEDDMLPPAGSFNKLVDYALKNPGYMGAIGGIYMSKVNNERANIALQTGTKDPLANYYRVINTGIIECKSIGGGFTLWNMRVIKNTPKISIIRNKEGFPEGWDWVLSKNILNVNNKIFTDTDLIIEHLC